MKEENKEKNTSNTIGNGKEEKLQKAIYHVKMLEEQAKILNNQIIILNGTLQEMEKTVETLDGLSKIGHKTKEILFPVGKNLFVCATLKPKNVLFGITDNIFIEKTPEDAKNGLNEDIKKINGVIENLKKKHSEIINKIYALSEYTEQLARQE